MWVEEKTELEATQKWNPKGELILWEGDWYVTKPKLIIHMEINMGQWLDTVILVID